MKAKCTILHFFYSSAIILLFSFPINLDACSTFKLQHGDRLIYAHNLNEGDIGVPGLIFINKRGIFKTGRTWSELTTKKRINPSTHTWISRYGSVTFNTFGRDFPDGGMNEAGLYIWEMNEDADYPKNDSFPKLNQMQWMQYILDNYSTTTEAIRCASEIEIDGWGWHFFVGDSEGNTAAVAFIEGKVVVHDGKDMVIPALFNTPYDREMELLKYFKGFGGQYVPDIDDPKVPRFVRTAVLLRDYDPAVDIIDYSFDMLDHIKVNDVAEWSIVFDAGNRDVYFKTRINPEIKSFSMDNIEFSNDGPVMILNMDIKEGGNVMSQFHPCTNDKLSEFTSTSIFPLLPEDFFTAGGITLDEYLDRTSNHTDAAALASNQFFAGVWKTKEENGGPDITIILETRGDAVSGTASNSKDTYPIDHISLIGNRLKFTFRTAGSMIIEIQSLIKNDRMQYQTYGIEDDYGSSVLFKE